MDEIEKIIGNIEVVSQDEARSYHSKYDAIITIEDPDINYGFRTTNGMPQLVLTFNDIDKLMRNYTAPSINHIEHAIDFARKHSDGKLLIHCHAGISRSPATALAIIADRLGDGKENEAVEYLYAKFKNIDPNERVVQIADSILNRDRKLLGIFRKKNKEINPKEQTTTPKRFHW